MGHWIQRYPLPPPAWSTTAGSPSCSSRRRPMPDAPPPCSNDATSTRASVKKHFRPELLNRLDEIVVFDPLSHEQLRKVARMKMKDVGVTDAVLDVILSLAYDPIRDNNPTPSPCHHVSEHSTPLLTLISLQSTTYRCMALGRSEGGSRSGW